MLYITVKIMHAHMSDCVAQELATILKMHTSHFILHIAIIIIFMPVVQIL